MELCPALLQIHTPDAGPRVIHLTSYDVGSGGIIAAVLEVKKENFSLIVFAVLHFYDQCRVLNARMGSR
jgi:hypothetical protein